MLKIIRVGIILGVLLVELSFSISSQAGDNVWTTIGPYGANFMSLAIDPSNKNIVYGTTPDGQINIFKSFDGGATWQAINSGIPDFTEMCRSDCIGVH